MRSKVLETLPAAVVFKSEEESEAGRGRKEGKGKGRKGVRLGLPSPLSGSELTALFADGYEIAEDYVPDVAFAGREGRERVRVLRRVA